MFDRQKFLVGKQQAWKRVPSRILSFYIKKNKTGPWRKTAICQKSHSAMVAGLGLKHRLLSSWPMFLTTKSSVEVDWTVSVGISSHSEDISVPLA